MAPTTGDTPSSRASARPAATSYGSVFHRDGLDCIRGILGCTADGTGDRLRRSRLVLDRALARVAVVDAVLAVEPGAPEVGDRQADHRAGHCDQGLDELGVALARHAEAVRDEAEDGG